MISRNSFAGKYPTRKLGEIVEFLDSKRRPVTQSDRRDGPYPYYGANGIQGTIDAFIFDEPLVLLAEDGGHFGDPDRGIAYRISGKTWVNNHAHVIRPTSGVDLAFLCRVLENYDVGPFVTGTTRGKLTKAGASRIEIPLPPLAEQRRIAEVLDRAEALRAKRRVALAQLDTLTQSLFLFRFGDPVSNPKEWKSSPLPDVCHCYSGGTPSKEDSKLWEGNLPWFSPKDLKQPDLFDSRNHISHLVPEETNLRLLPVNTVAIVVRGMILAHTFPVSVLRVPATINQDLKALLPRLPIEAQFLSACLQASRGFILKQVSTAGHGTKKLDAEGLRKIPILLPPLSLQREFARQVAVVEKLKNAHRASLAELDALFASLQNRAFRGEL